VKAGDVLQAGVMISNSEVGLGAIRIAPFTVRLVCTNGAIHDQLGKKQAHIGRTITGDDSQELYAEDTLRADDQTLALKLRDTIRHAMSDKMLVEVTDRMKEAAGIKIEGNPAASVEVLSQRTRLYEPEREGILRHLVEGGDLSLYGLGNAVTRAAADVESYDRATELENIGGRVITLDLPKADVAALVKAEPALKRRRRE
jgi:hypothetical protein